MIEKPKTIYKNGLRWNVLPKEVYGREVYVPCNFLDHYWSLGIKSEGDFEMSKKELSDRSKELLTSEKVIEKFSIICDKNQELKTENKELKKENHRLLSHLNEDKLRYMDRFIHQNKVIFDNLTEEYYNVDNNFTAQSLTNVLNNLNDELNQNKELVDIFKSSMKKYDIFRIIGWCCLVIGYFIIVFY